MTGSAPMLQAAKLWEKTSAAGNTYIVGRLGGVRVLILRNRDAGKEGEPDRHLFFADGSDKPRQAAPDAEKAPARRTYAGRRAYQRPAAPPVQPDSVAMPDDDVSDLYAEPER